MERKHLRHLSLFVAGIATVAATGISSVQKYFSSARDSGRISVSERQCDTSVTQETTEKNPNKMLFISCGGFLE